MHVFRGKRPKGQHRELVPEAGQFGGGFGAVTSHQPRAAEVSGQDAGCHGLPQHC